MKKEFSISKNTEKVLKLLSICTTFIFPVILWIFLTEDTNIAVFNYTWIALYSCIFVFLVHKNRILKILLSLMNLFAVTFLTLLFLMSDAELVWKVIAKTILPFLPIALN